MAFDPSDILETKLPARARFYRSAVSDMFVAYVRNNRAMMSDARRHLAEAMRDTLGIAEVFGARNVLSEAAEALTRGQFRAVHMSQQTLIPNVSFDEAVQSMIDRTPAVVRGAAERVSQHIANLYSMDRVVAFARSAELAVTEYAQRFITAAFRDGVPEGEAGARLAMKVNEIRERSRPWSDSYGRMVFRTNVNTAVTAGRFRQANDQDVRAIMPAFRFDAVGDGDTRHNHGAADGVILRVENPAWRNLAPPLGYNCRCQVVLMSALALKRAGRIDASGNVVESRVPSGAKPDDGFRHAGRPDLQFVRA